MKTSRKKHGVVSGIGEEEEEEALKRKKIEMEEVETKKRVMDKGGKAKEDKNIVIKIEMEEVETKKGL
jgi:hypothetical protein